MKTFTTEANLIDRQPVEQISHDFHKINNLKYVKEVLNCLPYPVLVLNNHRQIIIGNQHFLDHTGIRNSKDTLGLRPGEILNCINSQNTPDGCGTSKQCSVCEAVRIVLESQKTATKVSGEARIIVKKNGTSDFLDFSVTSTPCKLIDQYYYVVSLLDISSAKRKMALERIFFHDILNKAGVINTLSNFLLDPEFSDSLIDNSELLKKASDSLIDEINYQKILVQAESNNLRINPETIHLEEILLFIKDMFEKSNMKKNIITIQLSNRDLSLKSDKTLILRVLINLVKNATEASPKTSIISLGCEEIDGRIRFYVKNPEYIPENIQYQLFQRSFSTKGNGRGLGTYSIKLLTEKYLKGEVAFSSTREDGTTFFIIIPSLPCFHHS